jgi:hypothetical protein
MKYDSQVVGGNLGRIFEQVERHSGRVGGGEAAVI